MSNRRRLVLENFWTKDSQGIFQESPGRFAGNSNTSIGVSLVNRLEKIRAMSRNRVCLRGRTRRDRGNRSDRLERDLSRIETLLHAVFVTPSVTPRWLFSPRIITRLYKEIRDLCSPGIEREPASEIAPGRASKSPIDENRRGEETPRLASCRVSAMS